MKGLRSILLSSAIIASCIPLKKTPDHSCQDMICHGAYQGSGSKNLESDNVNSIDKEIEEKSEDDIKKSAKKDEDLERILALAEKLGQEQEVSDARKNYSYINSGLPLKEIIADYNNVHPQGKKHRKIIIEKSARRLSLYLDGKLLKQYQVGLHVGSHKDKEREGDGQTPEGTFYISSKLITRFYKSLLISYPSKEDASRGLKDGLINRWQYNSIVSAVNSCKIPPQKTSLGGEILIHGGGGSYDWTAGCIALNNKDMDEIYSFAQTGCVFRNAEKGGYTAVPMTILRIMK